jgi:hypothetical protein
MQQEVRGEGINSKIVSVKNRSQRCWGPTEVCVDSIEGLAERAP